jgi:dinuclear metal center YbgI/SA1388 family protein
VLEKMELNRIVKFLDRELRVRKIKDESVNGLQVKAGSDIERVGFAVDSCMSTFEKAKKENVDLLIVHHGIKWKPQMYPELKAQRENYLKRNNISLYGAHLPLDLHPEYGNNIGLARILNLKKIKRFGIYHGVRIGYSGAFEKSMDINQIAGILNKSLKTKCSVLPYGKEKIKTIGVVSGGASDMIEEAAKKVDCFLLGETYHGGVCRIKDYKLNVILGGHYKTEIVGVKSLMPLIKEKFNVKTVFIDNPTGF